MKAIVYSGPKSVELGQVPEPRIVEPTDALVRVTMTAICGTDLHVISGRFKGIERGSIIGHEFVGDVIETGSAVQRVRKGDHVTGNDFTACGHCRWCARGDHWECTQRAVFGAGTAFGSALGGAQAEIIRVPHADTTLGLVPASCPDDRAVFIGDNLATGWVAVERGCVTPGETVAVVGGGAIGQLTALCAQTAGAGIVVLVEPNAARREFAQRHGSIAVTPEEAPDVVKSLTGGDGADVAVDAVGGNGPLLAAFNLVRRRGRVVSVGTHADQSWGLNVARCFDDELSLTFALGDSIRVRTRLLALIGAGVLDPSVVISARVSLADAPDAYRELAAQKQLKVVIDPRA